MDEIINKLDGHLKPDVLNELRSVADTFSINSKLRVAHFLAQCSHESGNFRFITENLNYSSDALNKVFGERYFPGFTDIVTQRDLIPSADSTNYARNQELIASRIYGGRMGNQGELTKEGFKYRGRGYIQLTGKSNYEKFNQYTSDDVVQNPELVATKYPLLSAGWFWNERNLNRIADRGASEDIVESVTRIVNGGTIGLAHRIEEFNRFWSILSDEEIQRGESDIEEIEDDPLPPEESSDESFDDTKDNNNQQLPPVKGLKNFFGHSLNLKRIEYNFPGDNNNIKKESTQNVGYSPFLWYYKYQFDSIISMKLTSKELLPRCQIIFRDRMNFISDDAYPLDNSLFTIFLNSRSPSLKSIKMDFKIINYKKMDDTTHMFDGICNLDDFFIENETSYRNMTSFKCLEQFSKEINIGFSSNLNDTSDQMTWIRPVGVIGRDFVKSVVDRAYNNDNSFMWAYVDFYYNLNYIDINEALNIDISDQIGISDRGLERINKLKPSKEDTGELFLTNDNSLVDSNMYFSQFKITNRSTEISLESGYRKRVEFYDTLKKNYSIFDVDSQADDGKIILKSTPQDMDFYKRNTKSIYTGRLDRDNTHENYNYSPVQNILNINEIQKIELKITVDTPNYNFFRFQKINVYFSNNVATPTTTQMNKRLSGEWLIIDIAYTYNLDEGLKQRLTLTRRDLSFLDEEFTRNQENFSTPDDISEPEENTEDIIEEEIEDNIIEDSEEEIEEDNEEQEFDYDLEFSNSAEVDEFFNNYTDNNSGYPGFLEENGFDPINEDFYRTFWNSDIYDNFNIIEFLTISSALYLLTPKFKKSLTTQSVTLLEDNRNLNVIFEKNNTLSLNRTAFDNFNDQSYVQKNENKKWNEFKFTTDTNWMSTILPINTNEKTSNFITNADFFKFRQRGLLKFRGREDYENIIQYILDYTGNNETISEYKEKWNGLNPNRIATISTINDWNILLSVDQLQIIGLKNTLKQLNISNIPTKNRNVSKIQNSIKIFGEKIRGSLEKIQRPDNFDENLLELVKKQIKILES